MSYFLKYKPTHFFSIPQYIKKKIERNRQSRFVIQARASFQNFFEEEKQMFLGKFSKKKKSSV